jgi:ATP-dependent helicase HrpB
VIQLPIDAQLNAITDAVREHSNLILTASPGAGKTTRLPPELLSAVKGQVIVLEPRRMAAVSACHRVAEERGWTLGQEVGYQVRFESRVGRDTRLIFMTDALLLRRMIDDPELRGIDLIVLDEFHERNLNQDLILGALRELQELGRYIKVLIMSATLDVNRLQQFLSDAPHIEVPGKVFPLVVRHSSETIHYQTDFSFYDRVTKAVTSAVQETKGDILVFLPGTGEIRRLQERLEHLNRDIVTLHGSLPLNEQRRVLAKPERPRVILSTNVAEASVTVQGVDFVIDTGLAKVMVTNPHSGFSSLELTRISLFNARQRAGRAAREKSGVCLRLWTEHEERTQPQEMLPEIQRAELSQVLLWLANLGIRDFKNFSWLDIPPDAAINVATRSLKLMGALSKANELTERGKKLMRFPLPPRLGLILLEAETMGECRLGARVAALLNERDGVARDATTLTECDVTYRLGLLDEKSRSTETILQSAAQLERLMKGAAGKANDPRKLLLLSQRDRLSRRRGKTARGLMVGGRGVRLDAKSQVRESEFFLSLSGVDMPGQSETLISVASGFSKQELLNWLGDQVHVEESVEFVEEKEAFFATRVRSIDGLPIDEPSLLPVAAELVQDRLAEILSHKWEWLATKNESLGHWMARWKFLCRTLPEFEAKLGEEQISHALSLACFGKKSVKAVVDENLVSFLEMSMDQDAVRTLHAQVPAKFAAPSGVSHKIEYLEAPYVDVRLQEIFGLLETPRLLFDRVPLVFRLLGPNFRPVQITADLKNFWAKGYIEVRKELRARYPKHSWPEDPYTAEPEAKGRRR